MNRTQQFLFSLICIGTLAGQGFSSPLISDLPNSDASTPTSYHYCRNYPDWLGQNTQIELDIHQQVNAERAQQGLAPLQLNWYLKQAAQRYAIYMGCQGVMAHHLDGQNAGQRIAVTGYASTAWAENIAVGYTDALSVVAGWMQSPGHRANILDESSYDLTETGIGAFLAPNGRFYYCQVFAHPYQASNLKVRKPI